MVASQDLPAVISVVKPVYLHRKISIGGVSGRIVTVSRIGSGSSRSDSKLPGKHMTSRQAGARQRV